MIYLIPSEFNVVLVVEGKEKKKIYGRCEFEREYVFGFELFSKNKWIEIKWLKLAFI